MLAELKLIRGAHKKFGYNYQWDSKDFKPVEVEIEALMLKLGWISQ